MLVLSRKANERITIGDNITVTVVKIVGSRVELAISAPKSMRVLRGEIAEQFKGQATTEEAT